MNQRSYRDESVGEVTLHEYLVACPGVIPGDDINPDDPVSAPDPK